MAEIASFLDSYKDLGRIQSLCKAWRDGVRQHTPGVAGLGSHDHFAVPASELSRFSLTFPHATQATVQCGHEDDESDEEDDSGGDPVLVLGRMPSLQKLEFAWPHHAARAGPGSSDEATAPLLVGAGQLTSLTSLNLRWCDSLTEATAERLVELPLLTELRLPSSCLGHGGCAAIARLTGLRTLDIVAATVRCKRDAHLDPACETALDGDSTPCVCKAGPSETGIMAMAAGLTSVTDMNLSCCWRVSAPALTAIAGMPALTSLALQWVRGPKGIAAAQPSLGCLGGAIGLSKLLIRRCAWVKDADMAALCALHDMQVLSFVDCDVVTNAGVQSLLDGGGLPQLESLDLTGTRVTFAGLPLEWRDITLVN